MAWARSAIIAPLILLRSQAFPSRKDIINFLRAGRHDWAVKSSYFHVAIRIVGSPENRPLNAGGAIMSFAKPLGSAKIDKVEVETKGNIRELRDDVAFHQAVSNDSEMTPSDLSTLLDRVAGTSAREIDNLIGELQFLRKKLQTDGSRIQRDITEYAALSQSVMQLTKIVSDSVKKLPDPPSAGG